MELPIHYCPFKSLPIAESQGSDHGGSHGWHAVWTRVATAVQSCTFNTKWLRTDIFVEAAQEECDMSANQSSHAKCTTRIIKKLNAYHEAASCSFARRARVPRKKSTFQNLLRVQTLVTLAKVRIGPHRRSLAQPRVNLGQLGPNLSPTLGFIQAMPCWTRLGTSSG